MRVDLFVYRSQMPASASEVYAWHAQAGAFQKLVPPGDRTRVEAGTAGLAEGGELFLRIPVGPFALRWHARIYDCVEGERFRDMQVSGPFAYWQHSHLMRPIDSASSELEDRIAYVLPLGSIGRLLGGAYARRRLHRLFEFRHAMIRQELLRDAGGPAAGD